MHARDWFLAVIAFFLPPVAVFVKRGFFSADFLINIVLLLLGFVPGLIHAWYIIAQYPYTEGDRVMLHSDNEGYGAV
ncbi:hypothetical protein BABINDRAFT_35951 [Babjeviella inositovora NRRL Y-12698]|uniref:Plasma membrane proteolipid 3 n=1 Tax=Babjeviella inositovora NRRL Y-12698 TaxID=984486 RepID=A0A1E3QTF1_9ASCO|nr:uncharacterized protein BABINDRAFT_35951 [Babjeviella inositovora NRRL Y-12698]ODQ80292.1 hypothetical protein BABINDRAFT_35951 [Babjeviella inositovora NRRL Y-12698]